MRAARRLPPSQCAGSALIRPRNAGGAFRRDSSKRSSANQWLTTHALSLGRGAGCGVAGPVHRGRGRRRGSAARQLPRPVLAGRATHISTACSARAKSASTAGGRSLISASRLEIACDCPRCAAPASHDPRAFVAAPRHRVRRLRGRRHACAEQARRACGTWRQCTSHGVIEALRARVRRDLDLVHRLDRETSGCSSWPNAGRRCANCIASSATVKRRSAISRCCLAVETRPQAHRAAADTDERRSGERHVAVRSGGQIAVSTRRTGAVLR